MSAPENEFEFGIVPVVVNKLEQIGFKVVKRFFPDASADERYGSLVMPESEHEWRLKNHNVYARWQWEQEIAGR